MAEDEYIQEESLGYVTDAKRSYIMSKIKGKDTKPEILLRKALFKNGFRYSLHNKKLPGSPDIVLKKYRSVIFVNGCFWHGHEGCKYYKVPKNNIDFWEQKIRRNRERDIKKTEELKNLNWNVVQVWECELKKSVFDLTIDKVISAIEYSGSMCTCHCKTPRKLANKKKIKSPNQSCPK